MNEYIFYTPEGHTDAPNDKVEVENCQLLGMAEGKDVSEAKKNLLLDNPWISEAGFDLSACFVKQLFTDEQQSDIKMLIEYILTNKERWFEEGEKKEKQILNSISRLKGNIQIKDIVRAEATVPVSALMEACSFNDLPF